MKLFKNITLIACLLLIVMTAYGQEGKAYKEKSDPEATKILKNLKKIYGKFDGLLINYELVLEYGDDKEIQKGNIYQKGEKYRIDNNGNVIINDGEKVLMYIKKQNEIQVNDIVDDEEQPFTPAKILNIDENNKEFVYVITGEDSKGYKIEFKPLDRDSEIMKIRIRVNKAQTEINSVKIFSDDGSRMTFIVKSIKDVKETSGSFNFDKTQYPGIKEIDLRD
jgi:outer membrane lipoprotein-sorting protein